MNPIGITRVRNKTGVIITPPVVLRGRRAGNAKILILLKCLMLGPGPGPSRPDPGPDLCNRGGGISNSGDNAFLDGARTAD